MDKQNYLPGNKIPEPSKGKEQKKRKNNVNII